MARSVFLYDRQSIRLARYDFTGKKPEVILWRGKTYVLRSDGGYYEVEPLVLPERLHA